MNFFSTIQLVFRTLRARKGRSLLTILGIVIGVAGVIIIIALGAGAQSLVLGQVTKLGSNLISVQPGKSNEKGPPAAVFGITVTTLVNSDIDAIRDQGNVPHATAITGVVQGSGSVIWGNKSVDTNFWGTDGGFPGVMNITMEAGRFFDKAEADGGANVVVLGKSVGDQLFAGTGMDPVGQVIKIKGAKATEAGGVPLRIVGVVAERGSVFGNDQDDQVYVPLPIGQQQLLGIRYLQAINLKVDAAENVSSTIADINRILMQRHRIQREVDADFTIRNLADAISILTTITDALRIFLTAMAAIALLVGGIGILNIMLVTVAERTREIGLRKAVGATNSAVRNQFLLEASLLTSLGGALGIIFGVIISYLAAVGIRTLGYDWAFEISFVSIGLAVGVSILTGVLFGLYPAFKAAKFNPIDALRYE